MVKNLIYKYLAKAVVVLLLGLILFGVFPGTGLAIVLLLVAFLRILYLFQEGLQQVRRTEPSALTDGLPNEKPATLHPITRSAPRPIREIFAEGMGVVAFALLLPLVYALYTNEIFSLERQQSWTEALIAFGCLCLYACPHVAFKSPAQCRLRIIWWAIPFLAGLFLLQDLIETRHPYLNPYNPDRNRLAAEHVLLIKNNVVSGYYAGWISRYAEDLEKSGDTQKAIHLYEEALRREPNQPIAAQRLKVLLAENAENLQLDVKALPSTTGGYWTNFLSLPSATRHPIDKDLENVPSCTVVIVSFDSVDDRLLDALAFVVHQELKLPVLIAPSHISLPPYSRKRGLATNPQWQTDVIISAFTNSVDYFPKSPIRYLVVTSADIYMEQSSYVFSQAFPWGGVISSARFSDQNQNPETVCQRTAKQSLCVLIKSFGLLPSLDPSCVTSYSNGIQAFDAKGNRPTPETMARFQQALAEINQQWIAFKTQH